MIVTPITTTLPGTAQSMPPCTVVALEAPFPASAVGYNQAISGICSPISRIFSPASLLRGT